MLERTKPNALGYEVTGSVKWFNLSKGYGFIIPNDGRPDVFFHLTVLMNAGYRAAYEGTIIRCIVVEKEAQKLSAVQILSMDESQAIKPVPSVRPSHKPDPKRLSKFVPAQVKWFKSDMGFGFLVADGAFEDIFIHSETLRFCEFSSLKEGQMVQVRYGLTPGGRLAAAEVREALQ